MHKIRFDRMNAENTQTRSERCIRPRGDCPAAYRRKEMLLRRDATTGVCESDKSKICAECNRKSLGQKTTDKHHVAGKANDPITISVPVNDHRARLSADQMDWPKETRENPDGSPLLAAAAGIRGFVDTVEYLLEKLLLRHAAILEETDAYLVRTLGRKWWLKTDLKQLASRR